MIETIIINIKRHKHDNILSHKNCTTYNSELPINPRRSNGLTNH